MTNIELTLKRGIKKSFESVNEAANYLSKKKNIEAIDIRYEIMLDQEFIKLLDFSDWVPPESQCETKVNNCGRFFIAMSASTLWVVFVAKYKEKSKSLVCIYQQLSSVLHNIADERMIVKYALFELAAEVDTDLATLKDEPIVITEAVPIG